MITIITNGRILDCVGEQPTEDSSVIIEDGIIKDVYSGRKQLPEGKVVDVGGRTVLPGLIDAHTHPATTDMDMYRGFKEPPIVLASKIRDNLERELLAGFTTIRDMGVGNVALKQAVEDGVLKGPRMFVCNHWLSQTGGVGDPSNRGDFSGLPKDDSLIAVGRIVDGPDEARKAAREQLRAGADQLKVYASAGIISRGRPDAQNMTNEEIRAVVEEAEAIGTYVGAHATNDLAIRRCLECGVRTIEHGTEITEETAVMLKEKGAFFVSTIAIGYLSIKYGRQWGAPEHFVRRMEQTRRDRVHMEAARVAHEAGATICAGSDCVGPGIGYEGLTPSLLVEAGMTHYEAIKASTINNAKLLRMEDKIGSIEIGKWADVIVVDGHPDGDAYALAEPNNVRLVMKKGEIFKLTL